MLRHITSSRDKRPLVPPRRLRPRGILKQRRMPDDANARNGNAGGASTPERHLSGDGLSCINPDRTPRISVSEMYRGRCAGWRWTTHI
jgi:hypothetical protein